MHMLFPISLRNRQSFFQSEPTVSGTDSAMNGFAQPPIGEHDSEDFFSWTPSPPPVVECAEYNSSAESISQPVPPHTPYPHKDAVAESLFPMVARSPYCPTSALITSHHVAELRSRLTTAGFHSRRREDFVWSHFFPRSVGFAPTASKANGAFTVAPSMLCHNQASLPSRHIPPVPYAKDARIPLSVSTLKSTGGWNWRSQIPFSARPSIGIQCAIRRQCLQRLFGTPWVCGHLQAAENISAPSDAFSLESAARPVSRVRRTLSMI